MNIMPGKRSVDDLPMSGRLNRLILALPFECLSVDKVIDVLIAYGKISFGHPKARASTVSQMQCVLWKRRRKGSRVATTHAR